MDFESAQDYLKGFFSYEDLMGKKNMYNEKKFNLQRIKDFAVDYGVDYSHIKFVHVAGSKGKGSVCSLIAFYLSKVGRKTGLFVSPYIIDLRECFWIDGKNISKKKFISYVEDLKKFIESRRESCLTYFEFLTILVLKYFVDEGVDYAVLEVGLGGRLDATNIIEPELCVLTFVEKEHTEFLGDTVEEIIGEKLGIFKKGVSFLFGYQSEEVEKLIRKKFGNKKEAKFIDIFSKDLKKLSLKGKNDAQVLNGEISFCALKIFLEEIDFKIFKDVFLSFKMIGRFDVRKIDGKTVVFDIAHTKNSIKNLISTLRQTFFCKTFVFLIAIMKGKNVDGMLELIFNVAGKIVFVKAHEKRGFEVNYLKRKVCNNNNVEVIPFYDDCVKGFYNFLNDLKKNQILVVTGSHFHVGKILRELG